MTNLLSLPLDILEHIIQCLPLHHRNAFFMATPTLNALHHTHCRSLPSPDLVILRTEYTYNPSAELVPHMVLALEPFASNFPHFASYAIFIRSCRDPNRTLLLPFMPILDWDDHRAFSGGSVEMWLVAGNGYGAVRLEKKIREATRRVRQVHVPSISVRYYCWTGDAQVHLPDGTTKSARDIRPGDELLGASGGVTTVRRVKETVIQGNYKMVKMGDFLITRGHPIWVQGDWYRPDELFPVVETFVEVLYNFYAEPEHFVVVGNEKVVCSSLGGYCGRLAEMDVVSDVLYGRGYGSREAEEYKWLLGLRERVMEGEVRGRVPEVYEDLYPGREDLVVLGRRV